MLRPPRRPVLGRCSLRRLTPGVRPLRRPALGRCSLVGVLAWAWCGAIGVVPVGAAAQAAPGVAPESCGGVLLLVDRSGSMADADPSGGRRLGLAAALDRAGVPIDGGRVAGFTDTLGAVLPAVERWESSTVGAMAGGDRGPTDLAAVLGAAAQLDSAGAGASGGAGPGAGPGAGAGAGAGAGDGPGAGGSGSLASGQGSSGPVVVLTDPEADGPIPSGAIGPRLVIGAVGGAVRRSLAQQVRRAGGRVLTAGLSGPALRRAVCGGAAASPARRPAVVLVGGLRSRLGPVLGADAPGACARGGAMGAWCEALVVAGMRVWVVPMAPGGGGGRLNSTGRVRNEGAALARWVAEHVPGRAVLVGHSMGGLVAHAATLGQQRGSRARALITIGTPHAGSFGADAYEAGILAAAGCVVLCPAATPGLMAAAAAARRQFGAALPDLTRTARLGTGRLPGLPVPLAAYAGATSTIGTRLFAGAGGSEYLSPHDGIVGRGSATGRLAGLGPIALIADGTARHSRAVGPRGAAAQLDSAQVREFVTRQARRFAADGATAAARAAARATAAAPAVARATGASAMPARRASPQPTQARRANPSAARRGPRLRSAELRPVAVGALGAQVAAGQSVVATAPFAARCGPLELDPVPTFGGLWWVEPALAGCTEPVVITSAQVGAGAPVVVPSSAATASIVARPAPAPTAQPSALLGRLTVRRMPRRGARIVVRGTPDRPVVRCDGRRVRLLPTPRVAEWPGQRRRWQGALGRRRCAVLSARARSVDGVGVGAVLDA